MSGMFRLQDQAALDALLARSNCTLVQPLGPFQRPGPKADTTPEEFAHPCPYCPKECGTQHGVRVHIGSIHQTMPKILPPPKMKAPKPRSEIEALVSQQIRAAGLPKPVEWPDQFKPLADRKYRVDFYWPHRRFILEVDGAVHRVKKSFKSGFERDALLKIAGFDVLHVGGSDVRDGSALRWLVELMGKM